MIISKNFKSTETALFQKRYIFFSIRFPLYRVSTISPAVKIEKLRSIETHSWHKQTQHSSTYFFGNSFDQKCEHHIKTRSHRMYQNTITPHQTRTHNTRSHHINSRSHHFRSCLLWFLQSLRIFSCPSSGFLFSFLLS